MKAEKIIQFLKALGITDAEQSGDWIRIKCPFAEWTHEYGDRQASFSILASDTSSSFYYCFCCSPKPQPLAGILPKLWLLTGKYPIAAAKVLSGQSVEFSDWKQGSNKKADFDSEIVDVDPLPKKIIRTYPLLHKGKTFEARRCREYLINERLISEQTITQFGVRYCQHRQTLVFPYTDKKGKIYSLRMRNRKQKSIFSVNKEIAEADSGISLNCFVFPSKRRVGFWFGLHLIDWDAPVILVEGEIDALRLFELGKTNVIASGGTGITRRQLKELSALQLILGYDADKGGQVANEYIKSYLKGSMPLYRLDWTLAKKTNNKPCKDAGDLPDKEALHKVFSCIKRY